MRGSKGSAAAAPLWAVAAMAAVVGTVTALGVAPDPRGPGEEAATEAVRQEQILRGRQLVLEHGCGGCHGGWDNPAAEGFLAGVTSPAQEFLIGPCAWEPGAEPCFRTRPRNLTPHPTTGMGRFSERQIFNSLRYGLRPGETADVEITSSTPGEGNFPMFPKYLAPPMPWTAWRHMPDEDLWAIAAYLKDGLKPVDNLVEDSEGPPDFWVSNYTEEVYGTYPLPPFPTANEQEPPASANREQVLRGRHLVVEHGCGDCHGGLTNPAAPAFMAGVTAPVQVFPVGPCLVDPEAPCFMMRPRNLTPHPRTGIGRWTDRQLFNALRHGLRPAGNPERVITADSYPDDPDLLAPGMVWVEKRHMSDDDLWAVIAYLRHGLKPVENEVEESDLPAEGWEGTYLDLGVGTYPAAPFPTANEVGG